MTLTEPGTDLVAAAAVLYAIVVSGVVAFQVALALGAPWGGYAMGGTFPGRFPPRLRVAAVAQGAILAGTIAVVLARAGLAFPELAEPATWITWVVVALALVALVLNAITPNAGERRIWVPVTLVMLVSSVVVALSP
ncbi:MAG TPA: hypothetical protein VFR14_07485 [Candidatus Limnocylindrales bacterium]|nr:hypothetical protein [Candidatus Limnocylindrales bacterium]